MLRVCSRDCHLLAVNSHKSPDYSELSLSSDVERGQLGLLGRYPDAWQAVTHSVPKPVYCTTSLLKDTQSWLGPKEILYSLGQGS